MIRFEWNCVQNIIIHPSIYTPNVAKILLKETLAKSFIKDVMMCVYNNAVLYFTWVVENF